MNPLSLYSLNKFCKKGNEQMEKIDVKWPSVGHLLESAAKKYNHKALFIYEAEKLR